MTTAEAGPDGLLRRAREGDNAALGELLERYRAYLALLARLQIDRRFRGKADPADLARRFLRAKRRDVRLERELAGDLDRSSRALGQGLAAPTSTPSQQA